MKQITILGAGPAGLMSAVYLKSLIKEHHEKIEVTILEKNERVGKKILSTGNGKCNYSNINASPTYYNNPEFVKPILDNYSPQKLSEWFERHGLLTKIDSEGRMYPITENASSLLDVLRMELERREVRTIPSFSVSKIKPKGNGYILTDGRNSFYTDVVVISTGGSAAPVLGSTGDASKLLGELGISSTKRLPGLVGLKTSKESIRGLSGLRMKALVKLYDNNNCVFEEKGEIQFKDDGISGIVIMNASSKIMRNPKLRMIVDFLPNKTVEEIYAYISNKQEKYGNFELSNLFVGLLPNLYGYKIIREANISPTSKIKHLNKTQIEKLIPLIKEYQMVYTVPYGFDRAQVTIGGIELSELNEDLELKNLPNVYVCGEALDIDGMCGGYNLHFAFTSGIFVARKIFKKQVNYEAE